MSEIDEVRRTASDVIIHEALSIVEHAQWHRHKPRGKELLLIGKSVWTITQKLVTLWRIQNAKNQIS